MHSILKVLLLGLSGCVLLWANAFAIVNGVAVGDQQFSNEYPWVVAIVSLSNGGICGGTLIAPRWVLTAAHCTGKEKYVLVGNADRLRADRVEVEKAIRHPDFDKISLQNDVGLLYLAQPVDIKPALTATLAEARALLVPGASAFILGWGKPAYKRPPAERLVSGVARLDKLTITGSLYIYDDPRTGPCGFDSGGPMVMRSPAGMLVVVGVASATNGNLCAQGGGVAVYTNVAVVRPFIDQQLRRFKDAPAN